MNGKKNVNMGTLKWNTSDWAKKTYPDSSSIIENAL